MVCVRDMARVVMMMLLLLAVVVVILLFIQYAARAGAA